MEGIMGIREQRRKWMIFVACIWIQAFTGTNFDFSSYSSELKSILRISQLQLNYLSMASDLGKAFGWCSGVCLLFFPLWVVVFIAAFMGFVGYGCQWLLLHGFLSFPYYLVFLQSLLAGISISWFNTVSYVLCIKNFPANRPLALSLSICFNGVSAALYNQIVNAVNSNDCTLYLLLNGLVPLIISIISLVPIIGQPLPQILSLDVVHLNSVVFQLISIVAAFTGIYLLVIDSTPFATSSSSVLVVGAVFFLIFPLITTGTIYAWEWACIPLNQTGFDLLVNSDDSEVDKNLMEVEVLSICKHVPKQDRYCEDSLILKDKLVVLEEEHSAGLLMKRWDFWLYYIAYLCGGTVGIVYSNNLGQIAQSLGFSSETSSFVSLYSACSFFGRLLSAAPDLMQRYKSLNQQSYKDDFDLALYDLLKCSKVSYPRTGWFVLALVPTPIAFISLVLSGSKTALKTATALIGLGSGFVFSAAVSITSELFGPNSAGINHNLLITNIPIGSFVYGILAALLYESNMKKSTTQVVLMDGSHVCMGRQCYNETFLWWSLISLVGVASGFLLFLRTRPAYDCLRR